MIIRKEQKEDIERISEVTIAAFKNHPISNQTEHFIVNALRNSGALTVSLVAEEKGIIIGHIAFSPISISDGSENWYGLGPISVHPEYQKQGIGKALIYEGISELEKIGGKGCALVGDPNFYIRFGFKNYPELIHEGIPQEVFLVLPLDGKVPKGTVIFNEGFLATI